MFTQGFQKIAKDLTVKMRATPAKHGGKDGRKTYILRKEGKKWTCTCPDFTYRQAAVGGECKHIRAHKKGVKPWELKKTAFSTWLNKISREVAIKKDPAKWKVIVSAVKAGDKGGRPGQWSARKAQLAVQKYKSSGGTYAGKKTRDNHLAKWTKEKWQPNPYANRPDPTRAQDKKGRMTRYLPEKAWKKLTPAQAKATDMKKVETKSQFVKNTPAAESAGRKARS